MFEIEKNHRINELIGITKSNSGVSGPELAKAHMELGSYLAEKMCFLEPAETTVVAIMRGGLFFAQGIYFRLGCQFQLYYPNYEKFERPKTKNVILVDSVINTGKTIKRILEPDMLVACNVINADSVSDFDKQLYVVRVSNNSYVGANVKKQNGNVGPDTTMRLFNQI